MVLGSNPLQFAVEGTGIWTEANEKVTATEEARSFTDAFN
jgi:hypothetical protein